VRWSCIEVVQNATGPLLVEIDKLPGNPLGITLTQGCYRGRRVIYIDSVASASIADRSVLTSSDDTEIIIIIIIKSLDPVVKNTASFWPILVVASIQLPEMTDTFRFRFSAFPFC